MLNLILDWAIPFALSGVVAAAMMMWRRLAAMQAGIRSLLKCQIEEFYDSVMAQGYCTVPSLERLENLYRLYTAFCEQDAMANLMERMRALPSNPPAKD
ncbi:MAG: hypothetical protein LBU47_00990 [Christensenellaceae bacterium]|jgi:hypothetical protein|nr:hypothetical protein [Christensenellaceae bacterium]